MSLTQIWKQLGLNNKRNYFRVTNMLAKGCIVSEAEQHKKSMLYRLRTASNATLASNPKMPDDPGNPEQEPQSIVPLGMSSIYHSSQGKGLFCQIMWSVK